jgi:hypothetical protein
LRGSNLQFAWPIIFSLKLTESWWPYDALVVIIAMGFLPWPRHGSTRAARWRSDELVPRMWQLGQVVWGDVLVGLLPRSI